VQDVWKVVILAIVQGVTEFLPISSDGHLVVASLLMGVPIESDPQLHDLFVVLHFGTLLSIVTIYFSRLTSLLSSDRRLLGPLLIGSIPAGVIGVVIKKGIPDDLANFILLNPFITAIGFLITGSALLWGAAKRPNSSLPMAKPTSASNLREHTSVSFIEAFLIGSAQALAILPGVSRSGMTISTGLRLGLSPKASATFSFLLGVPVIFGATLLGAIDSLKPEPLIQGSANAVAKLSPSLLALGVAISFVVGVVSLKLLIKLLERGKFQWFAYWCIPLGIGLFIYALTR
jgi:undecaprenyl-diphosphatase